VAPQLGAKGIDRDVAAAALDEVDEPGAERERAYAAAEQIRFEGKFYRRDIGARFRTLI